MTTWWRASVLAAAGAAMLLAGCGIRVAAEPSTRACADGDAPRRGGLSGDGGHAIGRRLARASHPGCAGRLRVLLRRLPLRDGAAVAPAFGLGRSRPTPAPATPRERSLAAAARRVQAAAAVRAAVPAFDQLAAGIVARSGVPGAAVAVVAGDTVMYSRCFGLREMGAPDAVDDDTLFQIGGVSRAYTTTLLASLAGEGELSWDQPVRRVWPGFRLRDRWATRAATFRDLTAARSGLPAYAGTELRAFGYSRSEILRRLRYLRPAAGFRAVWAPQDALVVAAAAAAERATGQSWAQLMLTRVLQPAGADGTVLGYRAFVRAVDSGHAAPAGRRDDGAAGPGRRGRVRAGPRGRLELDRSRHVRAPATERGRARRRPRGSGRPARADVARHDGGRRRSGRHAGGRARLAALQHRRPARRDRRRRSCLRVERRRHAAPRRRRGGGSARQRLSPGPRPRAGARAHAHRLRSAGGAAGRLARRRAGRRGGADRRRRRRAESGRRRPPRAPPSGA